MSGPSPCEIRSVWKSDWLPFLPAASEVLSNAERERAARFHFDKDRDLFVVSHAALRILLSRAVGAEPRALEFGRGRAGKPVLAGCASEVRFNLSHSSDCALIGISRSGEIGVDVEKISAERGLEDLVGSHFSTGEKAVLDRLEGGAWVDCFHRVWTLKEAYLKAEGAGLIDGLSGIGFDLSDPIEAPIVRSPLSGFDRSRWSARSLDVGAGYAAAVVTEGARPMSSVKRFVPSESDFPV